MKIRVEREGGPTDEMALCPFVARAISHGQNNIEKFRTLDPQRDIDPVRRIAFDRAVQLYGEFDPGSGRTLAACLTHASRTRTVLRD